MVLICSSPATRRGGAFLWLAAVALHAPTPAATAARTKEIFFIAFPMYRILPIGSRSVAQLCRPAAGGTTPGLALASATEFVHSPAMAPRSFHILLCSLLVAASAQAVAARPRAVSRAAVYAQVSILAELGRRLFFDTA